MSVFSRFRRDNRGNVAMMFGLALVPLTGMVGAAIDYSRISNERARLVDALDAGVLAVGSNPTTLSEGEAYTTVSNWLSAHLPQSQVWKLDDVKLGLDGTITAKASGVVPMTLARVIGVDDVPIGAVSQAVRSTGKVELVLVIDNTGSMKGTKI